MACVVLIVHVFLSSIMQTYSHGMFSLLPLPRLLSPYTMHVSKLTIRFDQVELDTKCGIMNPRSQFALQEIVFAHFYYGWGVYCIDCSCVSYVWLINQCRLFVDKIKIFKNLVGAAYIQMRSIDRILQ